MDYADGEQRFIAAANEELDDGWQAWLYDAAADFTRCADQRTFVNGYRPLTFAWKNRPLESALQNDSNVSGPTPK